MLNWSFLSPRNLLVIGMIVLLTRFAFMTAINALDGNSDN